MTWTNWDEVNEGDIEGDGVVMSTLTGKWRKKESSKEKGFICKKMRPFSNCVATTPNNTQSCGPSGVNERTCHGWYYQYGLR